MFERWKDFFLPPKWNISQYFFRNVAARRSFKHRFASCKPFVTSTVFRPTRLRYHYLVNSPMSNSLSQWKLLANVTRPVPNPALECSLFLMERKKELDVIERFNKFRLDHCNLALNWRRCGCFVYLYIEAIPIRSLMDGSFEWGESLVRPTNRLRFVRNVRTERFANLHFWSSSSLTSAVDFNERTSISVCRKWWPRGGWTCSLLGKKDRKEIREIPTESVQWLLKHFQLDLWWTVAGVFSMRLLKGRELHSLNESCSFCVCNMHREWFAILDIFLLLLLLFCFFSSFFLWRRRPARRFQWAYELRRLFNSKRSLSKRKKKEQWPSRSNKKNHSTDVSLNDAQQSIRRCKNQSQTWSRRDRVDAEYFCFFSFAVFFPCHPLSLWDAESRRVPTREPREKWPSSAWRDNTGRAPSDGFGQSSLFRGWDYTPGWKPIILSFGQARVFD